ncbi:MAG TPA: winged helix-turn-helix domain-containing protein [Verrucomicrobiae bacterium]|nr:winged helix-turn-helix domain-containing protein [Verrucomicrobiae bacterium]
MADTYRLLRFGVFELNLDTEELRKAGTIIRLQPQPFQLLAYLASRSGQVVTREEIKERLWSDESELDFERRINQCIKQIRAALADNANQPVYVETLRLHGYRFIAPVVAKTTAAPLPRVTVSDSSGLERDIAARVMARITESPSQIGRIVDAVKAKTAEVAPNPPPPQTPAPATPPPSAEPAAPNQKIWLAIAIGAALVIAVLAGFLFTHH